MYSMYTKRCSRLLFLTAIISLLSLALVACDMGSSSSASTAKTQPTKAPVTQAPTTASTKTSSTPLQTYTGDTYTIGYPTGWKLSTDNSGGVTFQKDNDAFSVAVADSNGASADDLMNNATTNLQQNILTNTQDTGMDPRTTMDGETCNQKAFDGDLKDGGVRATFEIIICFHQANNATKTYAFVFGAPRDQVDQDTQTYFGPMLDSFKFSN